jgi:PhnB protein
MPTATRQAVTPMLAVHDAARALEFYKEAFGATVMMCMDYEGKIGHAEIVVGEATIMLADEYPEHNRSPRTLGGSSVILYVYVDDVDAVAERSVGAGARLVRPIKDEAHGDRVAKLEDPFGHVWMLATPVAEKHA